MKRLLFQQTLKFEFFMLTKFEYIQTHPTFPNINWYGSSVARASDSQSCGPGFKSWLLLVHLLDPFCSIILTYNIYYIYKIPNNNHFLYKKLFYIIVKTLILKKPVFSFDITSSDISYFPPKFFQQRPLPGTL